MGDEELFLSKIDEVKEHLKSIDESMKDMGKKVDRNNEGKIRNQMRIEECEKDIDGFGDRITREVKAVKDFCEEKIESSSNKNKYEWLIGILSGAMAVGAMAVSLWK